jgi:hypothetical protein
MSEFISNCPKCRHQILCDTAYVGKRIACPVCLQEINMPEPPQQSVQTTSNQAVSAPPMSQASAGGKRNVLVPAAVGGGVVLILAAVGGIFAFHKGSAATTSTPMPGISVATASSSRQAANPSSTSGSTPSDATGPCRAIWTFNQGSGNTVIDITGNGYNAKVVGDAATWVKSSGGDGGGLRLGNSNYVEVAGPVVNTAQSFTVAAWVSLDKMEAKKNQPVVSMDGDEMSGFVLGFFPYSTVGAKGGLFEFGRQEGDSKDALAIKVMAKRGCSTNAWYHLAGVYDAGAQTISLYENGNLQGSLPFTNAWQATGKTAIGRDIWEGRKAHCLNGIIRDVRFYSVAMTADQIKEIAR